MNGPLGRDGLQSRTTNLIQAEANDLNKNIKLLYNQDFNDVEDDVALSCQDKRALSVMENTIELKNGHYGIALPWKHDRPSLPRNKPMAENRLKLLKKRLEKDSDLLEKYSTYMDDLIEKGYARQVPQQERGDQSNVTWYLPHHPVFHPQKPGKLRVVFDCAAQYASTSLNNELLQGPDLTNSMV